MKEKLLTLITLLAIIALLTLAIFLIINQKSNDYNSTNETQNISDNTVIKVIDGDTFQLYSGEIIRLICIDAPEISTEKGKESQLFLESLILNKEVNLESDIDDKDEYGRLLRYAYLDSLFINKELVKEGYASIFRYGNNTEKCDEIISS